jgi:hypothetical protein
MWKCPECGVVNSYQPACSHCKTPAPVGVKPPLTSGLSVWQWYRIMRWSIAGDFCIGLGLVLMFSPALRDNPQVFSFSDLLPGLAAVIAGLGALGLAGYVLFRRR